MLAMPGVPGIYVHSLLGSGNDIEGMNETGRARSINREKFQIKDLEDQLSVDDGRRSLVFEAYQKILKVRQSEPAFHPQSDARYPIFNKDVFAIERGCGVEKIMCLFNFSDQVRHINLSGYNVDLLTGSNILKPMIKLNPWDVLWLK
jgi:sucrose phosphorylase